ncbi:MAG: PLDc_N domain-containing protein [Thioclava marina]|jgi:hypothetical protein|nr:MULTISPECIES: PLD nuclease N-terminal domain-containing protein [Thioclava]MBC7146287.1 PLDc_N domain-containing protein [Thioclava marina]TNE94358.1 MAG: PLDc_N domain-containing protein [Paracoccaceae bacterium]TNF16084.1 MAG: PLDc_N domain-containing protein [Paracoccaceae bacterium]
MHFNMTHLGGFWGIVLLALDIWALVSIVGSNRPTGTKVLWALLVFLLPLVGFLIWLIAGPRAKS